MWNRKHALLIAFSALVIPAAAVAQTRTVVSKEISVGQDEATLHVEFSDAGKLTVSFRSGEIVIGDKNVASYAQGGRLDASWRTLLGKLVSLDDGALSDALRSWKPPSGLGADATAGAKAVASALDKALAAPAPPKAEAEARKNTGEAGQGDTSGARQIRALLDRTDQLSGLAAALRSVDVQGARIRVNQDVDVKSGETVDGSLVVIGGSVKIAGEVDGDVVVVGGSLDLLPGGKIDGDVHLADASISRDGGTVTGDVVDVTEQQSRSASDEVERQVRAQVRREMARSMSRHSSSGSSLLAPVRRVLGGVGGIFQDLVAVLFLGLVGAGVVTLAGTNLDAVAETARRTPGRSAMVGVAGAFLLVPVWVVGAIALAVSIVGIPVMIAWLPLFPLAVVAAAVLGYLAVAHDVGQWFARSNFRFADRIRVSNPIHTVFAGLIVLMAAFIVANAVSIVPFFGFFRGLLAFVGVMISIAAVLIGFGAVLLTRAGTRPEYGFTDLGGEAGWDSGTAAAASTAGGVESDARAEGEKDEADA